MKTDLRSYSFIKGLTLDSGIGLDHNNQQVRMLSGCPELGAPWDLEGRKISTPPVERRHLEMAKRNIEERFIVAAPLEKYSALVWFLKRLHGWPSIGSCSRFASRRLIGPKNQYDTEVYDWVNARFAKQIEPLEPNFSREVRLFDMLNRSAQRIDRLIYKPIHKNAKRLLFSSR